ncbi:MAG: hypothetical protein OSJ62_03990 [Lachnospiraceae bacterium]|nr:hypothetical protein [Lachnospiraceae bacterium]
MNKQIEKILYYKKWKEKRKRHLILKFDTRFDTNFYTKGVQNGMEMVRERKEKHRKYKERYWNGVDA